MLKTPLVSIITPSYNQSSFLEQTIQSVLAQDYENIEYILVDGASTDSSLGIIQSYAKYFAWWVSEPDEGQTDAINKGLKRASGEIVAWLNSDDIYLPQAISQAVRIFEGNPQLGMVFANAITIDAEGKPLKKLIFSDWGLEEFMAFRIICQPAVFMRRSVLETIGYLDQAYHCLLDHQLWIRIARTAPICYVNNKLEDENSGEEHKFKGFWAAARQHPNAKNVANAEEFSKEILILLKWMEEQPDLADIMSQNEKEIKSGAFRLHGRYLLDGDKPKESLVSYWTSFKYQPAYAIKHWHRMLYALTRILGIDGLDHYYYRVANRLRPNLKDIPQLRNWPGLLLNKSH